MGCTDFLSTSDLRPRRDYWNTLDAKGVSLSLAWNSARGSCTLALSPMLVYLTSRHLRVSSVGPSVCVSLLVKMPVFSIAM